MIRVEPSKEYLRRKLSEYYDKHSVLAPPRIDQREFGAGSDKKIDFRHLAFRDENTMNTYIRTSVPLYISYSAGYYEFPDKRPMARKNWQSADLIFDLDADEYETSCDHDASMVCDICMSRVTEEAVRLVEDFLIPDFGFSKGEIISVFSGNRGYHLHIRREDAQQLSQQGRKELLDYLSSRGLEPNALGFRMEGHLRGPSTAEKGWGGKIARHLSKLIAGGDAKELAKKAGVGLPSAKRIIANKHEVINGLEQGHWDKVNVRRDSWERAFKHVAASLSVKVDQGVTMDVSRLIRLPTSIHGGTGFVACYIRNLGKFDPLKDPIVLGTSVERVKGLKDMDVRLGDETIEFRAGKEMDLPEYAAYYGCAKGLCVVE